MTISQKPRVKVEEEILNDFMRILEENKDSRNPWSKPWNPSSSEGHINFLTGNRYQGMNVLSWRCISSPRAMSYLVG